MAADFNKPITTDNYATVYTPTIVDNLKALAQGLDPAVVTPANIPTNAIRFRAAANKWEKYNGTSWVDLATTYAINISGSAAKWGTGRTITFTGAATGASDAFDGSENISIALTLATVAVNKGGTNITSYTVGDLLYASGATTLAKRAAVASGYALISGGVGAAPSWGKIGLTTHITGTLPVGNGGTGATDAAGARSMLGLAIGTDVMGMGGGAFTGSIAAPNLSGSNSGDEPSSSTTVAGVVELATTTETQAGTDATRAVTPAGAAATYATIATGANALAGSHYGQTLNNVKASRSANTNYTNTTSQPIFVAITAYQSSGIDGSGVLVIGGEAAGYHRNYDTAAQPAATQVCGIVMPGQVYSYNTTGTTTILYWIEHR